MGLNHLWEDITRVTDATHFDIPLKLPGEWLRERLAYRFNIARQRIQQREADSKSMPKPSLRADMIQELLLCQQRERRVS